MSNLPHDSSDLLTANKLIRTVTGSPLVLTGAQIISDGAADATLIIYDSLTATGKVVFKQTIAGADLAIPYTLPRGGIECKIGVFAAITGAGAQYIAYTR